MYLLSCNSPLYVWGIFLVRQFKSVFCHFKLFNIHVVFIKAFNLINIYIFFILVTHAFSVILDKTLQTEEHKIFTHILCDHISCDPTEPHL